MVAALLAILSSPPEAPLEFFGQDVGVRIEKDPSGSYTEALYAKDAKGKMRLILASPTRAGLPIKSFVPKNPSLQQGGEGLFVAAPSFEFASATVKPEAKEAVATLTAKGDGYEIVKELHIPKEGGLVKVAIHCRFQKENPVVRYLLDSYAFAPDGKPMKAYRRPDATYAPAIRPRRDGVIADHFFRSPVVCVQQGPLAASIMPDLDVLKDNRYAPTIVDLDCASGVVDAPLMSYGFAGSRLVGHVYFANDASMTLPVPPELVLAHDILLDAKAAPYAAYQKAAKYQWERYGHRDLDKILPQAMLFEDYAKTCYPAAFTEKETGGWFEQDINGQICGGLPSGWGRGGGWVSWQSWFNQIRSAWGLHWWGKKLGNAQWTERSNKMLNLALAAPLKNGACPTTYDSKKKEWIGSLIQPDPRCYYDLTNIAWKGIWLLRWLEFEDCPRKEEILKQCHAMANLMVAKQNKDGSIPTWLDKDLNVIPILDHSAQTALPLWFICDLSAYDVNAVKSEMDNMVFGSAPTEKQIKRLRTLVEGMQKELKERSANIEQAANFLADQVVDGQYWYDFETFFSCSPKKCFQVDGASDHEKMRDPHTLQAPQNTLSMQWTAEALMKAAQFVPPAAPKSSWRTASLKALDTMTLYQNVWPISYRKAAYTYGGFGVQNSDGEYDDARQAQFGETLCDFGVLLNRRDYFERGVAAVRATTALINAPLHEHYGIYPNPNYPLGLEPENDGHGGRDEQNGRSGTDWGELSGLTSMARLLDRYGSKYNGTLIDSMPITPEGSFLFFTKESGEFGLSMELLSLQKQYGYRGRFVNANGQTVAVEVFTGSSSDGEGGTSFFANATAPVTRKFLESPVHFEGEADGRKIQTEPTRYFIDPVFDMKDWRMPGWTFEGNLLSWPLRNPRPFDWNNDGLPFLGTCENGKGAFEDELIGTIASPWFLVTKPKIRLKVGGGSGNDVYVELLSANGTPPKEGMRIAIARGSNSERMQEVTWDVSKYKGQHLQIRIVDHEKDGWGHINVGNIRCSD